jgi:hypothetical protein
VIYVTKRASRAQEPSTEEEQLKALTRQAHEAAQEVRDAIRELGRLRDDLELSVIVRVEKRMQRRFETREQNLNRHEAKLVREIEECGDALSELTAQFMGAKTWEEVADRISQQTSTNLKSVVIDAMLSNLADVVDRWLVQHLAKMAGERLTDLAQPDKPGGLRIVTNLR